MRIFEFIHSSPHIVLTNCYVRLSFVVENKYLCITYFKYKY